MKKILFILLAVAGISYVDAGESRDVSSNTHECCACVRHKEGTAMEHNLLWSKGRSIVIVIAAIVAIGLLCSSKILVGAALCFLLFSLYFFRNPSRVCKEAIGDPYALICPADGVVVDIAEIEDSFVGAAKRISIFLSPLDVHVQWSPVTGSIDQINYRPGEFLVAYAPKSSDSNERNDLCLITEQKQKLIVRQIAGFVARRICWWITAGDMVHAGDKYGMIRFGSRVDLIVPRASEIQIKRDERVYGGMTLVGRLPKGG